MFDPVIGDPDRRYPVSQHRRVAVAIAVERISVAVIWPAVEFDDQPLVWEVGVDLNPMEDRVHERGGQAITLTEAGVVVLAS